MGLQLLALTFVVRQQGFPLRVTSHYHADDSRTVYARLGILADHFKKYYEQLSALIVTEFNSYGVLNAAAWILHSLIATTPDLTIFLGAINERRIQAAAFKTPYGTNRSRQLLVISVK